MNIRLLVFGIITICFIFFMLKIYSFESKKVSNKITTKSIVRVGIFGAFSAILYIFVKFPVPFFPSFLEFHFDEVPAFIASFAYGPISGFCVLLIKTVIKLPFTTTLCVGEIADLIYSTVFIIPAAIIYKNKRNFKAVLIGLALGMILQLSVSVLVNIYVMIPFYMDLMGLNADVILSICQNANSMIRDISWSFGLFAVLPFNLIKNMIVIVITIITYKSLHNFVDKIH